MDKIQQFSISSWIRNRFRIINLGLFLGFVIGFIIIASVNKSSGYDWYEAFYPGANNFKILEYVHPVHLFLLLKPLTLFPERISYFIFVLISFLLLKYSCHLTKAKLFLVLLTYPTIWVLWNGQIDMLVAFGVALGYYSLIHKLPFLVGIAITLLMLKPHIGGLLGLAYLFWSKDFRSLVFPIFTFTLTILVADWNWPLILINNFFGHSDFFIDQTMNISLFPYGMLAFLFLLLPLARMERIIVILSGSILMMPYSPGYSTLSLLILPLSWWIYTTTYISILTAPAGYWTMIFVPLGSLVWVGFSAIRRWRLSDSQEITREVQ